MRTNFAPSLAAVLVHEGGYVDNPHDPGGATNKGITQNVYDNWRRSQGLGLRSVKSIQDTEVEAIYRHSYWDTINADGLILGVDYAAFDFAVNSGASRAAKFLQQAVGATQDGIIGQATLIAVAMHVPAELIDDVCDLRMTFLRNLPTFEYFGTGWTKRVSDVRTLAKEMAS